jgi:hypothetical protein
MSTFIVAPSSFGRCSRVASRRPRAGSSVTLRKWSRSVSRVNRSRAELVSCSVDSAYRPRGLRTVSAGVPLELGAYHSLLTVDGTFVDG